jgi:hypothetical protein
VEKVTTAFTIPDTGNRLAQLSSHHQLLLEVARKGGELSGTQLGTKYRHRCIRAGIAPIAPRTVSKYLGVLCLRRALTRDRRAGTNGWVYRAA